MSAPPVPPPPLSAPCRRAVVVLGMHRGGTSAVAGQLHRLGVDFGPRLMPANADNPSGYYEHNDVVNLHDRFLLRLDATWDALFPPVYDPARWDALAPAPGLPTYREELLALLRRDFPAGAPTLAPWGLKDPRLCLLLPWWEPLWATLGSEPFFVIVLRHPAAVAASLHRRDGFSSEKSHLLWLQHLLRAERDTRGRPRCFVDYDNFLTDWRGSLRPVEVALGDEAPWSRTPALAAPGQAPFLDPVLRHHQATPPDRQPHPTPPQVGSAAAHEQLRRLLDGPDPGTNPDLDDLSQRLLEVRRWCEPLLSAQENDAAAAWRAQRRISRWYEEEWLKAEQRTRQLEARCLKQEAKLRALKTPAFTQKQPKGGKPSVKTETDNH